MTFRLAVMAHASVGCEILQFLLEEHPEHVSFVVIAGKDENPVHDVLRKFRFPSDRVIAADSLYEAETIERFTAEELDIVLLAWWPLIVKEPIISLARRGTVNLHPSLLPHCRGKAPNFWSIVEGRPFGVTIHYATDKVDAGDILFQRPIPVNWDDTGGTLHQKACTAMVELFQDNYEKLAADNYQPIPVDLSEGSFHFMRELDPASEIQLEKKYTARELLNLLRARTFPPYPACYINDEGETYEVRVSICRKEGHEAVDKAPTGADNNGCGDQTGGKAESRIPVAGPSITDLEISYVTEAARSDWYGNAGSFNGRFEEAFAEYIGVAHAISLPSCTSGLHLSLAALGVGPGDEVIVPDITWIASAAPISYVGATPVFADIDPATWCLSPSSFESLITDRTKAVIPVNLYGNMADLPSIRAIADARGVAVVEDAAEAIGSRLDGKMAGAFGHTGVFSFHGSKTMTTGEGGMVVTDDEKLYKRMRVLCDHGRNPGDTAFLNSEVAFKYKMSGVQAALGLGQLQRVEELVAQKRLIFRLYADRLHGVAGVSLNPERPGERNSCWMTTVVWDKRFDISKEELAAGLRARGIDSRPFFHPLSSLPAYAHARDRARAQRENTRSYNLSPYGINLPCAQSLTEPDVVRVCEQVQEILADAQRCVG